MKAVFTEEVAQYLGYQKYWPEKKDWVIAIVGCLALGVLIMGVICGVLIATGNWDKQFEPDPCVQYANGPIGAIPAKCASYFGLRF